MKSFSSRKLMIGLLIASICLSITVASNPITISLQLDNKTMTINGRSSEMDVAPFSKNRRTLVPVRFVSEALNASVYWLPETQQVRVVDGNKEIVLTINSTKVLSSGKVKYLDVPAEIINSRIFVPLRFVSEELGAKVEWDGTTRRITITK